MVATRAVVETIARGSGYFQHAQTYSHSPVACAAGLATLRYLKREKLVERCAGTSARLFAALAPLREIPQVGDVRGIGMLAAVELVADRAAKTPFTRSQKIAERVTERAFANGLIVWPNVGHVDGAGDLLMLAPPLSIGDDDLLEIGARLERALREVFP